MLPLWELGIPCVVGVQNLLDELNEGDDIIVDSDKGIIKKEERRIHSDRWRNRPFFLWYYMMIAKTLCHKELDSNFIWDIDLKIEDGILHLDKNVEDSYLIKWKTIARKNPKQFWELQFKIAQEGLKELEELSQFMENKHLNPIQLYKESLSRISSLGKCVILSRYPITFLVEQELTEILKKIYPKDYEKRLQILATTSSITTKGMKKGYKLVEMKKQLVKEINKKTKGPHFKYLLKALEFGQKLREESHQHFFALKPKIEKLLLKINWNPNILYYLPSEILLNKKPKNILIRKEGKFLMDREVIAREIKTFTTQMHP